MKLVICDLDGVVNSSSDARKHLVPHITNKSTFWSEWHKAHTKEALNLDVRELLNEYERRGFTIIYLSNRQESCLQSTHRQLRDAEFPIDVILLRHPLDDTPPPEYKARRVADIMLRAVVDDLVVIEDCGKNIDAIRQRVAAKVERFIPIHVAKFTK